MQIKLKDMYGQRTTPRVKILLLITIIIFGLCTAFSDSVDADKKQTHTTIVK